MKRNGVKQFALFRVNDIGEIGEPTEPHIFPKNTDARDAILNFPPPAKPKRKPKK